MQSVEINRYAATGNFVAALQDTEAPLAAMSGLLTGCQQSMQEAVAAIREAGLETKILIGGSCINEAANEYIKADFFTSTDSEGVKIVNDFFGACERSRP